MGGHHVNGIVAGLTLALIAGSLISLYLFTEIDIRRIGAIPTGLPDLQLPVFTASDWILMVTDAAVLAVLGSIDALLTSVIAENLTRKESDANKELFGQGMGNLAAGLFGGIHQVVKEILVGSQRYSAHISTGNNRRIGMDRVGWIRCENHISRPDSDKNQMGHAREYNTGVDA